MPMWKIQKYRMSKKLTQENLAEAIDVTPSYVSEIETGKKRPSMKTLEKIAAVLDVPLVALMDDGPDADEGAIYKLQKQVREEHFTPRLGVRKPPEQGW